MRLAPDHHMIQNTPADSIRSTVRQKPFCQGEAGAIGRYRSDRGPGSYNPEHRPKESLGDLPCDPLRRRLGFDVDPDEISTIKITKPYSSLKPMVRTTIKSITGKQLSLARAGSSMRRL
jgi:hypothetical protein